MSGIALVCFLGSGELASELVVLGAVVAAVALSLLVYRSYRVAAREQKRLESVTKSPLFAYFGEVGVPTEPSPHLEALCACVLVCLAYCA